MFAEFVAPYIKQTVDGIRSLGCYAIKHTGEQNAAPKTIMGVAIGKSRNFRELTIADALGKNEAFSLRPVERGECN
jgi:hypothetical protein